MSVSNRKSITLFVMLLFLILFAFACVYNCIFSVTDESEIWIILYICISTAIIMVYLLTSTPLLPNFCIAVGLIVRVAWLLLHRNLIPLSNWLFYFYDQDGKVYNTIAQAPFSAVKGTVDASHGVYPDILRVWYRLVGPSRLFGGWSNVLLFVAISILTLKILQMLKVNEKGQAVAISVNSLLPFSIMYNVGTFRECVIIISFMLSLYCFLKWFYLSNWFYAAGTMCSILFACYVHAGMATAIVVYIIFFIFYDVNKKKFCFSSKFTWIAPAVLVLVLIMMQPAIAGKLFFKLRFATNIEKLLYWLSIAKGDSAYLEWIDLKSLWELVWYIPLKTFYFFAAPVPWEWRGLQDAAAFCLDSLPYLLLLWFGFSHVKKKGVSSMEWILLALLVLGLGAMYACGTFSAGTATRHRLKLLPLLSIFAVYSTPCFHIDTLKFALPKSSKKIYDLLTNQMIRKG